MIVIAAILERGDIFLRQGVKYRVTAVDEYCIYYSWDTTTKNGKKYSQDRDYKIGLRSKQKLILIEDCDYGDVKNIAKNMVLPEIV